MSRDRIPKVTYLGGPLGHTPLEKNCFGHRIKIENLDLRPCVVALVARMESPPWNPKYATGHLLQPLEISVFFLNIFQDCIVWPRDAHLNEPTWHKSQNVSPQPAI